MKSKAAKILEVLLERRTAFKAVLLFVMAVSTIQWVHYHLAFVYRGFLVWGALIIAWDFFHGKKLNALTRGTREISDIVYFASAFGTEAVQ